MSNDVSPRFDRRAFLGLIAAAGGVACTQRFGSPTVESPSAAEPAASPSAPPSASPAPAPSASASASPTAAPGAVAFQPVAGDAYPNAKRVAGRFVEALTTFEVGAGPQAIVRAAAKGRKDRDFDLAGVVDRAAPLLVRDAASEGAVVYPQLGGLTLEPGRERAAVMVVVRQGLRDNSGGTRTVTRTVDVRLINRDDRWRIEDLADAGGRPPRSAKSITKTAQRVLDDTRIELPDSARWDILRGDIDERLLETMLGLAAVAPYSVAVLKSGHPYNVFGTDLISGHTHGRGVDIWRVAGQPVVLQQPSKKSKAHALTASALRKFDVPELGSPWDLDGPPVEGELRPSFTDAVHADHIHVAFKAA